MQPMQLGIIPCSACSMARCASQLRNTIAGLTAFIRAAGIVINLFLL